MGNKRSQSALRKAAAANKKNCNEPVQMDHQDGSVEPAKLDENDNTHRSRPVRKKVPTPKLLESLEYPAESDSSTQASKEDQPYASDGSQEANTTSDLSEASDSDLVSEAKEVKVTMAKKGRGRPPKQKEELSNLDRGKFFQSILASSEDSYINVPILIFRTSCFCSNWSFSWIYSSNHSTRLFL